MKNYKEIKFLEKSPFQFWQINLILPRINYGKVSYSDDYDSSISNGKKYSIEFKTDIGYYLDDHSESIWLILFGFGICISEQDGY